jgi:hypothetical protein
MVTYNIEKDFNIQDSFDLFNSWFFGPLFMKSTGTVIYIINYISWTTPRPLPHLSSLRNLFHLAVRACHSD